MNLIANIHSLGWLFNNCYQQDDGTWRVNLRRPDDEGNWFTEWAEGSTFEEALEDCMMKMQSAEHFENEPEPQAVAAPKEARITASDILRRIGKAKPKFERRF